MVLMGLFQENKNQNYEAGSEREPQAKSRRGSIEAIKNSSKAKSL